MKFFGKIGHWVTAYSLTSPEFLQAQRANFKSSAFAEVYIDGLIDYDAWMFTMLNRVTLARTPLPERQVPHVAFQVKFKPANDQLDNYSVKFELTASGEVKANLTKIANDASASMKPSYPTPTEALPDVEKALAAALETLAGKLGNDLAPNLMVRYQGEVFWNGHVINVLATDGDYVELEAIGKDGQLLNPSDITWTNADASQSRGIVDLAGVGTKQVTLRKGNESMTVSLKRVNLNQDVNELLKRLIIETLSTKKQQAIDTLAVLRRDSVANAQHIKAYIAYLERGNFPMQTGGTQLPMFSQPLVRGDSALMEDSTRNRDIARSLHALKTKKKLRSSIRRKMNVVALADLVVDRPERVKDLLDELLKNSGRLVARLLLNTDSKGQVDEARNIVVEFLNNNLERIAGGYYPPALSQEPPLVIPSAGNQPQFDPKKFLYVSAQANFVGKDELISYLNDYLPKLDTPLYVFINYTHDTSVESYLARSPGAKPVGIPDGVKYKVFTVLNMPGSLLENATDDQGGSSEETVAEGIKQSVLRGSVGAYQFLAGRITVVGSFSEQVSPNGVGFSFLTPTGQVITVPSSVRDVTFNEQGLLAAFTLIDDGRVDRFVSAYYTKDGTFAGYVNDKKGGENHRYHDVLSGTIGSSTSVFVGFVVRSLNTESSSQPQCGITIYTANFPVVLSEADWNHAERLSIEQIVAKMPATGTVSNAPQPLYNNKINLVKANISSPEACDLCSSGVQFMDQYSPQVKSDAEYQALFKFAKTFCYFDSQDKSILEVINAELKVADGKKYGRAFLRTDAAIESFWSQSNAWQLFHESVDKYFEVYLKLKSNGNIGKVSNETIKSIVNARTPEFIGLFDVQERLAMIKNLLPEITANSFSNYAELYVSNSEENAIIKVLRSVTKKDDATAFLDGLSSGKYLHNLSDHLDDFGFGSNNYSKLAKEFQRIVLVKNDLAGRELTINDIKSVVPAGRHFVCNDSRLFAFGVKPEQGSVFYERVTFNDNGAMDIGYKVCVETREYTEIVGKEASEVKRSECVKEEAYTSTPNFFDLISIDVVGLHFVPESVLTGIGTSFVTYAGFLDYIEEKRGTEQVSTITECTVGAASFAFGIGELALAIRAGATTGRIILASVDLGSEVADLVIHSDAFASIVCSPLNDCNKLKAIKVGNTVLQVTAILGSTFDIATNWDALKTIRPSKFKKYKRVWSLSDEVLRKLDAEQWTDDLLAKLESDLGREPLRVALNHRPDILESWIVLQNRPKLRVKPEALESALKLLRNPGRNQLDLTDEVIANIHASRLDDGSFKDIVDDLDAMATRVTEEPGVFFDNFNSLLAKFNDNNTQNSQAAHWIVQDITANLDEFRGKTWRFEHRVTNSDGNASFIDAASNDVPPMLIEYKWLTSNTVNQDDFIREFIKRDLFNATDLNKIQWRIKGQKLSKEKALEYLGSPAGKAALKKIPAALANQLLKRVDLDDVSKDEIVDAFITYFGSSGNFNSIFR